MKKLTLKLAVLLTAVLFVLSGEAQAIDNSCNGPFNVYINDCKDEDLIVDASLDLPHLIEINENLYIGAKGGKKLTQTNLKEGWFIEAKATGYWTLFSFSKEK